MIKDSKKHPEAIFPNFPAWARQQPNFLSHFFAKSFAGLCVPVKKNSFTNSADSAPFCDSAIPCTRFFSRSCRKKDENKQKHKQGVRKNRNIGWVEDATQRPFMVNEVKLKTVSHFSGDSKRAMIISAIARICCRRRRELNCTPTRRIFGIRVTNTAFGGSIDLDVAIRWTFICNLAVANQFRSAQSLEMRPSATKHVLQWTFSIYSKHCVEYVPPDFLRYLTLMLKNAETYIVSGSNKARQVRRLSPWHLKPLFISV